MVLEIMSQYIVLGAPSRLSVNCRFRQALQTRGLRLMALTTWRTGSIVEADYRASMRRCNRALSRLEDLDEELGFMPCLRSTVRQLLVERNILANLLNAHPRMRREAGRLREAAEDTYPELGTSDEEDEP